MLKKIINEKSTYRDIKDGEYDLPLTTKKHTIKLFGITIYKVDYTGNIDSEIKIDSKAKGIGFGTTK